MLHTEGPRSITTSAMSLWLGNDCCAHNFQVY